MRHSVATPTYLFRRTLENIFSYLTSRSQVIPASVAPLLSQQTFPTLSPKGWIPQYTMVTFRPDISYETVRWKAERQTKIIAGLGWCGTAVGILGFIIAGLRLYQRSRVFN